LEEAIEGLTYPANTVEYVFEDEPLPLVDNSDQVTLVVDMSSDGSQPDNVQSLSSSFMVSGFDWTKRSDVHDLVVSGISLDSAHLTEPVAIDSRLGASASTRDLFQSMQRTSHMLATRVDMVKKALDSNDGSKLDEAGKDTPANDDS
ncbi:hypothetical protein EC988_008634, partial [Linderina pennispora]